MLHFCTWPDRVSVLVDANDVDDATGIATQVADGTPPATCTPLPARVFAAEVFLDEDDDGAELLVVEPLPHVEELLLELDDGGDAGDEDGNAIVVDPELAVCGHEIEDEDTGKVYSCRRLKHADEKHEALGDDGAVIEWSETG